MTSPPFRYVCKHCRKDNWLMPHPKKFKCEFCGKWNKVIVILPMKWITIKSREEKKE